MTVCIAALCNDGENCVLASDQMTTAHFPIGYEFETEDVEKIVCIVDSAFVLTAGDVLFAREVIEETRKRLVDRVVRVKALTEAARTAYQHIRILQVVHTQLEPRGLNLDSYYQSQQRLMPAIVQMVDQALVGHNPGVELIIAGKDDLGCHIYTVQSPGRSICHNPVGFAAIGSGGPHAVYSLIEAGYRKSLGIEEVKRMIEQAKKRAEVAPGVGADTRIIPVCEETPEGEVADGGSTRND